MGKSTLFQAITKSTLGNPANFPYATINPEEARVIVPDARYDWLCEHYKPASKVPANLTVYDIAGLTRGASTGAGLGSDFLSHIRAVDAIFSVTRLFEDKEIIHVEDYVDPVRDLGIIAEELRIKDIQFTEKALEALKKQTARGGQSLEMRKLKEEQATVEKILAWLKDGKDVRKGDWTPKEVRLSTISPVKAHSMMIKSQMARYNPSSSMVSYTISRRDQHEMTSNSDLLQTCSFTPRRPGPFANVCHDGSGRGDQPALLALGQASGVSGQPQRERLHPTEEQIPTKGR